MENLNKYGIKIHRPTDKSYPELLKDIYDCPKVLYSKGNYEINQGKMIAIVGSRKPTYYGKQVAKKFAKELAEAGYTIVSGMARGIDTLAHIGALEGGGKTIAVLGSGLDVLYPKENIGLASEIQKNGAIISEFELGIKPFAGNFPRRNRIISGMCKGVLVIEAAFKSGTLITTDYALEQGREVFAVPGCINSIESFGTNKLIKDGAKIATCVEDILEEFEGIKQTELDLQRYIEDIKSKYDVSKLDEVEKKIFDYIRNNPIHINEISKNLSLDIKTINYKLTSLEIKGLIKHLAGNFFVRS